jgi:2-haloalkanoic acid dehalogenase type II
MMQLTGFKALSFDCYGTLIDWESGIWTALQPLIERAGIVVARDEALEAFGELETVQQAATPELRYSELLARVHGQLAAAWGVPERPDENAAFGASVPDWPAFPDSAEALAYLARHHKLIILSNVDRASFVGSQRRLGVAFDAVYTAEDIGCYKPDRRNFSFLIERLKTDFGIERDDLLHVAQSLFHDHEPAVACRLVTAWIDRRHGQTGWGATKPPRGRPRIAYHFRNLAELAAAHQRAQAEAS